MTQSKAATPEAVDRAILFQIALDMNRTVEELEHTMSYIEYTEWCAFYVARAKAQEHSSAAARNKNEMTVNG